MAEKTHPKLPSGQTMKWKDQDYPTVYANIMGLGMSAFDLSVVFGQIGDTTPDEVSGIPKVKVILAPEQAANLIKILTIGLQTYTTGNGQLRTSGAVNIEEFTGQLEAHRVKPKNES